MERTDTCARKQKENRAYQKGVDSLRTYMREVYVLRDALMQICKLPRNVAYHEALKAVGALSGRSIEALTDFFEKNVVKKRFSVWNRTQTRLSGAFFLFA